jgi:hypothetical protein
MGNMTTGTPLPIISGRQQPAPGTKRDKAMENVKKWLLRHSKGGTYYDIGIALGFSPNQVAGAALDLHLFDPSLVVSIPSPKNGYLCRAHWNETSSQGESNRLRYSATTQERMAVRLRKAATQTTSPVEATLMLTQAMQAETTAAQQRMLAATLDV